MPSSLQDSNLDDSINESSDNDDLFITGSSAVNNPPPCRRSNIGNIPIFGNNSRSCSTNNLNAALNISSDEEDVVVVGSKKASPLRKRRRLVETPPVRTSARPLASSEDIVFVGEKRPDRRFSHSHQLPEISHDHYPVGPPRSYLFNLFGLLYDAPNRSSMNRNIFPEEPPTSTRAVRVKTPPPPSSDSVVEAADGRRQMKCPICLDHYVEGLVSTSCGHVFCEPCARSSLKAKPACPSCRKKCTVAQLRPLFLND